MKYSLLLRRTEDWAKWSDEDYLAYVPGAMNHLTPAETNMFVENVKKWNQIYHSSFTQFRSGVADIATKNRARIDLPTHHCQYVDLPQDTVYLPIDDDDWFNPSLLSFVMPIFESNPDIDVVFWDCWQYQTMSFRENYRIWEYGLVGTNCYAIRGGLEHYYYWNHMRLAEYDRSKMVKLSQPGLSVYVNHPASFWMNYNFPLQEISLDRSPRPTELAWASLEIEELFALIKTLHKI